MQYRPQSLIIDTKSHYGKRVPMDLCGDVFRRLSPMMGHSVRMAVEGTSASIGAPPNWLRRASDVRVLGFSDVQGATAVEIEAPILGDAAKELYSQEQFWETRPPADDTAVNVLARVMREIKNQNSDSTLFDRHLLRRFGHLRSMFDKEVVSVAIPTALPDESEKVDLRAVELATELSLRTPPPAQVRISGKLDMIRHSTRSFGLLTDEGVEIRGVLESLEQTEVLKDRLGSRVLVLGRAIYRPSGTLLRIDANAVLDGEGQPSLFSKIPAPRLVKPQIGKIAVLDQKTKGVAAFFGTWPGEESEDEIERLVREVRS